VAAHALADVEERAKPVEQLQRTWRRPAAYSLDNLGSSLTQLRSRNSIPCSSKVRLIALRFRTCIGGISSTFSHREIAECETWQQADNSRTDQLSNARAARI